MDLVFDGDLVEKVAVTESDTEQLRAEAATLRAVAHPGVVRLVSATGGRISMQRVEGRNLSHVPVQAPHVTAGWGAALCTTVADLHGIGCVHTAITADHVILDGDGHPVLCGLGHAAWPSEPAQRERLARRDRLAVAALIAERLAGDLARRTRPARRTRSGLAPGRRSGDRRNERRLRRMLADGTGGRDESWLRDLARRLSEYARCAPAVPADPATPPGRVPPRARSATATVAASDGQAQVGSRDGRQVLQGLLAALYQRRPARTALIAAALIALVAALTLRSESRPQRPIAPGDRTVTVVGPSGPLELSLGSAGQLSLTVGRWTCSRTMPALLDVSSGNIWTFPGWPGPGAHDRGSLLAHVAGAVALRSEPTGPNCDTLVAITTTGESVRLKTRDSP